MVAHMQRTRDTFRDTAVSIISSIDPSDTHTARDTPITCPSCRMLVFGRCPLKILCGMLALVLLASSDSIRPVLDMLATLVMSM